jgi:hypothetical protein
MDQRVQIKQVVELNNEHVEFTGTLKGHELSIVLEVGLNTLLNAGVLPVVREGDKITPDRAAMN